MSRAAAMAYRILAEKVCTLPVDPLALLRACRDTAVLTFYEAADRSGIAPAQFERFFGVAEAFTLRENGRYMVVYRPDGNPARLRFTLAHELGHRALGHSGQTVAEESAADCFASHLLCPRPVVRMMKERLPGLTVPQLAAAFYVSDACAAMVHPEDAAGVDPRLLRKVEELFADAVAHLQRSL